MKTRVLIVAMCLMICTYAQEPIRIAQEEGTEVFFSWMPGDMDFAIDPNMTILPVGFDVTKDANGLSFHLVAGGASVEPATITVIRERVPGDVLNWVGPKVTHRDTVDVQWIVYRSVLDPFFDTFPKDMVLVPSP